MKIADFGHIYNKRIFSLKYIPLRHKIKALSYRSRTLLKECTDIKTLLTTAAAALIVIGLAVSSIASVVKEMTPAPSHKSAPHGHKGQTLARLARGKFLIARRGMKDGRFAQTVILIFEHSDMGAGGLIINRPAAITVKDALPKMDTGKVADKNIHIGGPVASNTLFMLIRSPNQPEGSLHVVGDIFISTKIETLTNAASDDRLAANVRIYAGYAGWAPNQLDREMLHNDWYLTDADAAAVFDSKADDIWPALMRALER